MPIAYFPHSLRHLLLADATTCFAMGALLALGHRFIGGLTALPPTLLLYAGLSLLLIAAFMAIVAVRPHSPPALVWLIIGGNGLWVSGSLLLLLAGWIEPNPLGALFIMVQAVAVAILAGLEYGALRRNLQPRTT